MTKRDIEEAFVYPEWVCQECGSKASKKQFLISTWHKGICGICGKEKSVTEPRDFYYPKFKEIKLKKKSLIGLMRLSEFKNFCFPKSGNICAYIPSLLKLKFSEVFFRKIKRIKVRVTIEEIK